MGIVPIKRYALEKEVTRRGIEKNKTIKKIKLSNRTYVIEPGKLIEFSGKERKEIIVKTKKHLDDMILSSSSIEQIKSKINELRVLLGLKFKGYDTGSCDVCGYSEKSLYRKIVNKKKIERKTRADKGTIRNEKIARKLNSHIIQVAEKIFFEDAKGNLKDTVDRVIEYSKINEDYYEIASVSKSTLYRILRKEFASVGYFAAHERKNHYNLHFQKRAYVTGAFTDDINFMDYFLGDDNKRNIATTWVYNERTRQNEKKEIKSWTWIEARTGKVLSYINKTSELNAEDVVMTLIDAIREYGLPAKGIIIDNGIGSSERFKNFIKKIDAGLELSGLKNSKIVLKLARPYYASDKSMIERSFGWTKNEFDSFFNNFVGGDHKTEGKHTTNALTPAQANYMFEDYNKQFKNFIFGFYETRIRTRIINGKTEKISIRDYWNRGWNYYSQNPVSDQIIRYALQIEKEFTYKGGSFRFNLNGYKSDYLPVDFFEAMPPSFYKRKFKILYNPNHPEEVDLYSTNSFIDKNEGLFIDKDQFICTLKAVRSMGIEKQKNVAIHNKMMNKQIKKITPYLIDEDINAIINRAGEMKDGPRFVRKKIEQIIKHEKPLQKIAQRAAKEIAENKSEITIEELEEIINKKEE